MSSPSARSGFWMMKRYGIHVMEVDEAQDIFPGFYTTGAMNGPVREQAALFRTTAGVIVCTGCAHPGIVPIIQTAKMVLPDDNLALVMGGFHLLDDSDGEILKIIAQFKSLGVRYAAASHCSGERTRELFTFTIPWSATQSNLVTLPSAANFPPTRTFPLSYSPNRDNFCPATNYAYGAKP